MTTQIITIPTLNTEKNYLYQTTTMKYINAAKLLAALLAASNVMAVAVPDVNVDSLLDSA